MGVMTDASVCRAEQLHCCRPCGVLLLQQLLLLPLPLLPCCLQSGCAGRSWSSCWAWWDP